MTSALKFGGGSKNTPIFVDKYYINFADREGGGVKNPKFSWTSNMEAPSRARNPRKSRNSTAR